MFLGCCSVNKPAIAKSTTVTQQAVTQSSTVSGQIRYDQGKDVIYYGSSLIFPVGHDDPKYGNGFAVKWVWHPKGEWRRQLVHARNHSTPSINEPLVQEALAWIMSQPMPNRAGECQWEAPIYRFYPGNSTLYSGSRTETVVTTDAATYTASVPAPTVPAPVVQGYSQADVDRIIASLASRLQPATATATATVNNGTAKAKAKATVRRKTVTKRCVSDICESSDEVFLRDYLNMTIIDFQKKYGLVVDGKWGKQCRSKMAEVKLQYKLNTAAQALATPPPAAPTVKPK